MLRSRLPKRNGDALPLDGLPAELVGARTGLCKGVVASERASAPCRVGSSSSSWLITAATQE